MAVAAGVAEIVVESGGEFFGGDGGLHAGFVGWAAATELGDDHEGGGVRVEGFADDLVGDVGP